MDRRDFLNHLLGISTIAFGAGMINISNAVARNTPVLNRQKIKVTGVKTMLIDNIPPYSGQPKWLFIQLLLINIQRSLFLRLLTTEIIVTIVIILRCKI